MARKICLAEVIATELILVFAFSPVTQAGEDLDEDEDDMDLDEEAHPEEVSAGLRQRQLTRQETEAMGERAPLLRDQTRGRSVARMKRGKSVGKTGDATVWQAVLMVRVAMCRRNRPIGSMILTEDVCYSCSKVSSERESYSWVKRKLMHISPARSRLRVNIDGAAFTSFFNGGILFSTIVMLGIAAISLWSFLLLVKTRLVIPGSFGGEPERFSSFRAYPVSHQVVFQIWVARFMETGSARSS